MYTCTHDMHIHACIYVQIYVEPLICRDDMQLKKTIMSKERDNYCAGRI